MDNTNDNTFNAYFESEQEFKKEDKDKDVLNNDFANFKINDNSLNQNIFNKNGEIEELSQYEILEILKSESISIDKEKTLLNEQNMNTDNLKTTEPLAMFNLEELKSFINDSICKKSINVSNLNTHTGLKILDDLLKLSNPFYYGFQFKVKEIVDSEINKYSVELCDKSKSLSSNYSQIIAYSVILTNLHKYDEALDILTIALTESKSKDFYELKILESEIIRISNIYNYIIDLNNKAKNQNIETLSLNGKTIGDKMINIISDCNNLRVLITLDLSNNCISDKGMKVFSKCTFLKKLKNLILYDNSISDNGMESLSKCNFLQNLEHLCLRNNVITDKGMVYFSKCNFLKKLIVLYLSNNNISDKGTEFLISCNFLKDLNSLYIFDNNISDLGIDFISKCTYFKNLTVLGIGNNKASKEKIESSTINNKKNFPMLKNLYI